MISTAESGLILALLLACLIALILVSVGRREAKAVREQASEDVREQREHMKLRALELDRRTDGVHAAERDLGSERKSLRKLRHQLDEREAKILISEEELQRVSERAERKIDSEIRKVAGLTAEEARTLMSDRWLARANQEAELIRHEVETKARREAEVRARSILTAALQRAVVDTVATSTVSPVRLPSDDLRGRIIGKEGRNIHAFEALTGVDLIVDDSSRTVLLSSFDSERREAAQCTLEALVADGRINPQRIEEAFAAALAGADDRSQAAGRQALHTLGLGTADDAVILVLGRLRLRTSYGQDVLQHSVETAQIAGRVAEEVGADVDLARRGALLHDIGKALKGAAGTHAIAGAEFLARHGESPEVVNAVAAHHDEVLQETIEAVIVQIADAASASRPGARFDAADQVVGRMEGLEKIALEHPAVRQAVAMSAGRDLRVVVDSAQLDDASSAALARELASQIAAVGETSGEVRVTVVREWRAVVSTSDVPQHAAVTHDQSESAAPADEPAALD